jgi:hypothetical protein
LNWRKWHEGKAKRSAKARRAAEARWERHHAALAAEPVRVPRVAEITIRDSCRPMMVVRLERQGTRWKIFQQGEQVGTRPVAASGLGMMLAKVLE